MKSTTREVDLAEQLAAVVEQLAALRVVVEELADLPRRLDQRIDRLERRLSRRLGRRTRARPIDRWDAELLVEIARATRGLRFTTRELYQHAALDGRLDAALQTATLDSPRSCGRWLCRFDGRSVAGVRVAREASSRDGGVWVVRASRV
jgi:hypothetical protein